MNTDVSKVIKSQLESVEEAVKAVASLSGKVDELANELHAHGRLSIDQLNVFKTATEDTHKLLDGLIRNSGKIDEFISAGSEVTTEIRSEVGKLNAVVAETTSSLNLDLERFFGEVNASLDYLRKTSSDLQSNFAVAVGQLQATLTDTKRQLLETMDSLTVSIGELSSRSTAELGSAAQALLDATEKVRNRLEDMPNAVETRILERVEPGMAKFSFSLVEGARSVSDAASSVTNEVAKVAKKSSDEISNLVTQHKSIIADHEKVSSSLQGFLNNADDFVNMSKALETNRALLIEIEKGLSSRKASIIDRFDIALVGTGIGYLIGHFVFGFKNEEVLATLAAPALAVLASEPLVNALLRLFRNRGKSQWTPPAPPSA
jgi:ABC-type transporter Mla subunit MlaD